MLQEDKPKILYYIEDGRVCCISDIMCEDCENRCMCKELPEHIEKQLLALENKVLEVAG